MPTAMSRIAQHVGSKERALTNGSGGLTDMPWPVGYENPAWSGATTRPWQTAAHAGRRSVSRSGLSRKPIGMIANSQPSPGFGPSFGEKRLDAAADCGDDAW